MRSAAWIESERRYRRVVLAVYLGMATLAALLVTWQIREIDDDTRRLASERGVALFQLIEITREWNARHGGVYAPVTAAHQPNGHLKHPLRDVEDDRGRSLTLVNPAYMTRQIAELAERRQGVRFHITSLRPLRPANQADPWEAETLALFEAPDDGGRLKERIAFFPDGGGILKGPAFRYMAPLPVIEPCMPCHAAQGYRVGDVRGGISVTMPADRLLALADERKQGVAVGGLLMALIVAGLLHLIAWRTHRHFKLLSELNGLLEAKVAERTREVRQLYDHEHYLRELLSTVSEINISLIHSYSMGSIIESSIERLKHHHSYRLILFGHFDGEYCHFRHVIGDRLSRFRDERRHLDAMAESELLAVTAEAVRARRRASGPVAECGDASCPGQRADDYRLTASAAFPLIDGEAGRSFDCITFWTDRPEGFEEEELKILDTVVSDITMALSAYKQRKLSERLYQENINNYEETILAFVDMIEQRDAYTAGHTLRVARYSRLLAEQMQLPEEETKRLEKAAILHDIGKIATPDTILLKPGRLSPLEYSLIQMHVTAGYKMLSKVKMYADLAEIIKFHHERHDGTGYPRGVAGDDIPRTAQIMIVADAFDAMTTNRIYKGRMSVPDAIEELRRCRGSQFHPDVVDAAAQCFTKVVIDEVSQLPTSDLDKQRFSYFFNDSLTGLFNTAYLQLVINRDETFYCANVVHLKQFSTYNRHQGWAGGNALLLAMAQQLRAAFPDSLLFRFHGDDFLILNRQHADFRRDALDLSALDPQGLVTVCLTHYDIRRDDEREAFRAALELD